MKIKILFHHKLTLTIFSIQKSPVFPTGQPDYLTTPFLERVEAAFMSRQNRLPPSHTLSQLLTAWELSVRAACSPHYSPANTGLGQGILSGL